MARVDWKPFRHFGLAAGYNFLYLKITDTVLDREFTVRQSVHGPSSGSACELRPPLSPKRLKQARGACLAFRRGFVTKKGTPGASCPGLKRVPRQRGPLPLRPSPR